MNDEIKENEQEESKNTQKIKDWIQDNIRIIVSVLLVCLIGFSIYSYAKRGENKVELSEKNNDVEKILKDLSPEKNKQSAEITDTSANDENNNNKKDNTNSDEVSESENEQAKKSNENEPKDRQQAETKQDTSKESIIKKSVSQETENSFIESASPGDSVTTLARKALAHYLEKNPDSTLTPEHKIYIEDYLRKNVKFTGRVYVGTSVEFSKNLIKNAISTSKNLTDSQLNNLHKYAVNVQF